MTRNILKEGKPKSSRLTQFTCFFCDCVWETDLFSIEKSEEDGFLVYSPCAMDGCEGHGTTKISK